MKKLTVTCSTCGPVDIKDCVYWEWTNVEFQGRVSSLEDLDPGIDYQTPLFTEAYNSSRKICNEENHDSCWYHKPTENCDILYVNHAVNIDIDEVQDGE